MSYYEPLVYIVPPEEEGFILKTVLQKRLMVSRKLLSRIKLTEQGITVNGVRQYINIKVKAGDRVEIRMEEEQSEDILPQDLPLHILHEDEHLLDTSQGCWYHRTSDAWALFEYDRQWRRVSLAASGYYVPFPSRA